MATHMYRSLDYGDNCIPPRTLLELKMMDLMGQIRGKPKWWEKVEDAEIVAKWKRKRAPPWGFQTRNLSL